MRFMIGKHENITAQGRSTKKYPNLNEHPKIMSMLKQKDHTGQMSNVNKQKYR